MNQTTKSVKKQINDLLSRASDLASAEVKRLAREILAAHPNLDEFIMAMGGCLFSVKNSRELISPHEKDYMKVLNEFLEEFDGDLKITGESIRFRLNGPECTEWGATDKACPYCHGPYVDGICQVCMPTTLR